MYSFPYYKEEDRKAIVQFMVAHPFVTLAGTNKDGRVVATQLPVLIEERDNRLFISGHIAKKMDHEKALQENPEVLLIFTGPHTYVSGTWYTGNPKQASTWNYVSIHARGAIRWTDEEGLRKILQKTSSYFENNNPESSTIYDNLSEEYISKLIKAIVGFELEVTELDNVHKLSQNRDEESYKNIISELKKQEGDALKIGKMMEANETKIFPK